jgi:hypothetical protein
MFGGVQVTEKNHFPGDQNRHILPFMSEQDRKRSRFLLIALAAALALATLAPVAVLAA